MGLIRNPEIKLMLYALLLITLIGTILTLVLAPFAFIISVCTCLLLINAFMSFTKRRYQSISDLSDYLKRVNSGDYSLELADHDEGELSILKSEIYKVTMALQEQNEKLKKEKNQLADSLSDISHQFKTPLTSMSVMVDLLVNSNLSTEKRREFTIQLRTQIERLKWLTEALLKLSKLDAAAVKFNPQHISLQELITRACESLHIPVELKGQSLLLQLDDSLLICDPQWTAEALTNILKNCVEYTPQGGVIRVIASTNALFTHIYIIDNGQGIDRADLPYIFTRYYRGKNASSDSVGIGLAMAKEIVEAQGGSIEAKSTDSGAEFNLYFPIKV